MSAVDVLALASLRLINLSENKASVVVFTQAYKPVAPSTRRAHEMQAETIKIRLGRLGVQLSATAYALPHGSSVAELVRLGGAA